MSTYIKSVMNGLANMLHNGSQNPSEAQCNIMLDSIKRTLKEYEELTGEKLNITDYRETRG